jgi:amino acid adenylation domain-containing protein
MTMPQIIEGFRLSPQQRRIWQLQQEGQAYDSQCVIRIEGRLKSAALAEALKKIMQKHQILRTTLDWFPTLKTPIQIILENPPLPYRRIDLSDQKTEGFELVVGNLCREESRPFDLKRDLLVRFCLGRLSASKHVILISLHPLCADSWTLRNLFKEISRFYAAELEGEELSDEPVQYLQFAEWQNALLEEETVEIGSGGQDVSSPLSGLMLSLESVPDGRSESARRRLAHESTAQMLDSRITERIEEISNSQGASVSGFLLACWQILLWRLSAEGEITIECLFDGRQFADLHDALGLFARYVPARGSFRSGIRFSEAVERALRSLGQAYASQELFLRQMAGGDAMDRSQAIGFDYEEWPKDERAGGVRFSYWKQSCYIDRFKLKLGGYRKADGLMIEIQYDPAVFSGQSIELIRERYLRLIESAVEGEQALIGDLEIIGRRERERLLVEWNETTKSLTDSRLIHELIGAQSRVRPESIAVIYQGEHLSYRELEIRANQLANRLRSLGVGPDSVVGLHLERSTEMMIGLLGILKAGGAYLPLEIEQPVGRLEIMLGDAGVRVVVTKQYLVGSLPGGECEVVTLDGSWEQIASCSQEAPETEVSRENLAYVIYTSGSTGRPKGVMVRHGSVLNLLEGLKTAIYEGEGEELTVSMNASLAFDASVKQVIQLGRGRRLCIVPEEDRVDAESMLEYIGTRGIEVLDCTPSQLRVLVEAGLGKKRGYPKIALVGGEAIDARSWREMSENREVKYYNVYGPTECTVDATVCAVGEDRTPTIGRPISNTRIYILDQEGSVAPTGVAGDIYIGGAGLARGYIGEARLTAEKFVPDNFGGLEGERLYRTGDRGRYVEDGKIEFLRRGDDQIKVRGYRIEPGEVAAMLMSHPGVREAVVTVREDEPGQKRLVGYVVRRQSGVADEHRHLIDASRNGRGQETAASEWGDVSGDGPGEETTEEGLVRYVRERLPDYMAPAAVVVMRELPLTKNGKVDRGALPGPEEAKNQAEIEGSEHRSAYEEIVSGIWKEILKVERVRRRDNFFEIGGHSLLATQIGSRVRKTLGVEIGVRSIFEKPTVEGLAGRIEEVMKGGIKESAPPLVKTERDGQGCVRLPLSFAQQRLWFLDRLLPGSHLYINPYAVRLEGRLDLEVLESVINEIVRRHEVLRTRFEADAGEPVQVIDEWEPQRLEVVDLTSLTWEEREDEIGQRARREAKTGFDLSRGPLLRVKVLKLEEEEHVVLYTMHHIVSDGWSMEILIREVGVLYQAYSTNSIREASPLAELPIQYADFAVWQRAWLRGEVLERELEYWREQLAGMEDLELPTDHLRPAVRSYRGGIQRFAVERGLTRKLRELSQREGVTLFMTLLAGFDVLMSRYSGQEDVVVGTDIANRNRAEIEGLIGFFVNQLVLRVEVRAGESFRELLKQVREACLGAYGHQDVPFEKLVEELQPERDLSRSPLFQTKLILQNAPRERPGLGELRLGGRDGGEVQTMSEERMARFDLLVSIMERDHDLIGGVEYSLDLFEDKTIERLMSHYTNVLTFMVEKSERPICSLDLLSDEEREQIVVEWNRTGRPYPNDRPIHGLFEEQSERTPERIALVSEGKRVSYRELNRRANQLGCYLQRLGVGPEVVVGVCVERSVEMMVAVLGVLKAGGAYLPLDPAFPAERLALLLEDAGVGVVLTQQRLEERLQAFGGETVLIDEGWERISGESGGNQERGGEADNLAYVIYTSGSTGKPKGVMVQHRGLVNYTLDICRRLGLAEGGENHWLQFATISTITADLGNTCIYPSLLSGGCLHVLSYEMATDRAQYEEYLRREPIDVLKIVPSHLSALLSSSSKGVRMLPYQYLILGGDALPPELVERIRERREGGEVINHYGPTETTIGSLTAKVGEMDIEVGRSMSVPIGRPITNTRGYILDRDLNLVPVCARGELHISGEGVARGYLGRPELTAERFFPDLFSEKKGERLYRTGDVVRYLSDGKIEFVGRADDQVKVRGYRVELAEIQVVLNEHPGVRQSVVVAKEDERGDKRLVGYVVGEEEVIAAELKQYARKRLPEYMVPEAILVLEEMPITANGKLDRKRLPTLSDALQPMEESLIRARDVFEHRLVKIWESVLEVQPIGVKDNFFDLGGHSILAAILMARIQSEFGRELPLSALFQGGTIERLASFLKQEASSMSWSCLIELQASGSKTPLFFVHPGGGNVFSYYELARCLGSDRPFYAFQEPGLYKEQALFTSIEDMAAYYVEAMKTVQPEGPYFIGGWSLGGIIAFEMARQLFAQDQKVEQLLVLDSSAPISIKEYLGEEYKESEEDDDEHKEDAILLIELFGGLEISKEDLEPIEGDKRIEYVLKRGMDMNFFPPDVDLARARAYLELFRTNARARRKYLPQVYQGTLTLFTPFTKFTLPPSDGSARSQRIAKLIQDPTKGWCQLATGGVRVVEVPGDHQTMVGKLHVETLALRIRECLDDAETIDG